MFCDDSDDETDNEVSLILQRFVTVPRISIRHNYFEEVVPTYSDEEFIRFFRVSRDVFDDLAEKYGNSDLYENIASQHLVTSARKALAVFLWFCSHEAESCRDINNLFNLSLSTVFHIIRRTISVVSCLAPREITWPTAEEMKKESEYHLKKYGITGIIGKNENTLGISTIQVITSILSLQGQ